MMAGDRVAAAVLRQFRPLHPAEVGGALAACRESTPCRKIEGAGDLAIELGHNSPKVGIRLEGAVEEGSRVRMPRLGIGPRKDLDNASQIHHDDAVTEIADQPEIVRDEQVRQPEVSAQPLQERDDLRLDRNVERSGGLIQHQERRIERQRACDADTLLLAARELMRIIVRHR